MAEFKLFQCHKQVHARPMTRGEYNEFRGWGIPANENPADEGLLVVYDRGTPDEYVSWSPRGVFERGYAELAEDWLIDQPVAVASRPAWQERVLVEVRELDAKIVSLRSFTGCHLFQSQPECEQKRLQRQLSSMVEYSETLHQRIAAFPGVER